MKFLKLSQPFVILVFAFSAAAAQAAQVETYSSVKTQFAKVGANTFAYRKYGKDSGVPLVLLMHTRGTIDGWDPDLLDTLARNRTVIAFDNKGVGLSDGEAPQTFSGMADDAVSFINGLGLKKVDLLGFSIGGAVAQEIMIRQPDLVRRAIVAGTSSRGGIGVNSMSERSKAVSQKSTVTDEDILYGFFAPTEKSQALGREYLIRVKRRTTDKDKPVSMPTVKAQAIARADWGQPQSSPDDRLKKVRIPILVANGKDDIRMPTINSYNLFTTAANAQLILYPDSGHGFLFQYPKLCGENFAQFLDDKELDK